MFMQRLETPPSLADRTHAMILDEICEGRLAPGTHLIQEQIAAELGVSRQPVQQALALLRNEGLVEDAPGRGLRVTSLDVDQMRGRYEVRAAIDALAARLAAECAAADPETAARIARQGEALIAEGEDAVRRGAVADMVRHDVAFHGFLYAESGNPFLAQAVQPHWQFLRRVMGDVLRRAEPPADIWQQHAAILSAVVAGDASAAEARANDHIARASDTLADASGGAPSRTAATNNQTTGR